METCSCLPFTVLEKFFFSQFSKLTSLVWECWKLILQSLPVRISCSKITIETLEQDVRYVQI